MHRAIVWILLLCSSAFGANWPQFRGPGAAGISQESSLPLEFGPQKNVAWKLAVPGTAWSSPIVWDDKVFLTAAIPEGKQEPAKKGLYFGGDRQKPRDHVYSWEVWAVGRDNGKILWKQVAHHSKPKSSIHLKNSYASETPATDGKRIVAYFGGVGLFAYDLGGKLLWSKDLGSYRTRLGWGTGSSPILHDGKVYVQYDNEEQSAVVCFDADSGKEIWRAKRDEISSWATPFLWETPDRKELITAATRRVRSYDPQSGQLLWELAGMSSIAVPTPFTAHGLCFIGSGYVGDTARRPQFAVRPGAKGDISLKENETSNQYVAWCQKFAGSYMPTPIVWGDNLYILYDRGMMSAFDAKTGKEIYKRQRLHPAGSANMTASPIVHQGRILCFSEEGDAYIIEAGPTFRIAQKSAIGEMIMATPAAAANALFLRTLENLYCYKEGATATAQR